MSAPLPAGTASLPPLGGRLFAAYRLIWWILLPAAVLALAASWTDPRNSLGILALRSIKSLVLVGVAAILFRRRGRDPVAALLCLSLLLWTISSSADFASASPGFALADRVRFLLFAFALLLFPNGDWQPIFTRIVAAAIVAAFVLGLAGAWLYLPTAIACIGLAILSLLIRFRRSEEGTQRQQLKWVVLGLVAGIGMILIARAGAASKAPMPLFWEGLFQLGIILLSLGFLISLLRYRLYDAEAAISRSAIFAGLTLALVGIFAACEALIEQLGQSWFGSGIGAISGAGAAAVAAVLLAPLHGRISTWAEAHFQRDLATLKLEFPDLLQSLSAVASVKQLAAAALPRIEQALHATRMAVQVDGALVAAHGIGLAQARKLLRGWQAGDHVDSFPLAEPLRCPFGHVRGWLLLGPRPDGSGYGGDEVEALRHILPALQRAFFIVAEREAAERRLRREFRSILRRLERVELDQSPRRLPRAADSSAPIATK